MKSNLAVKAGFWNTIANFVLKGISFLSTFVFAYVMTTAEYGNAATFFSYVSIGSSIVGLNLGTTIMIARFDFKNELDKYLSSVMSLSIVSCVTVSVICTVFYSIIGKVLELSPSFLALLIIVSFFQYVVEFIQARNTADFLFKKNIAISFAVSLGNLILSLIFMCFVLTNHKVFARIIGSYLVVVVIGIFGLIGIIKRGRTFYNRIYWNYGLRLTIPNIVHALSSTLMSQFDRIVIKKMVNDSAVGLYSLISTMGMVIQILWNSINSAWVPWLYRQIEADKKKNICHKSYIYLSAVSIVTILCQAVFPDVLRFCPAEYWSAVDLLVPVILAGYFVFLYSFPVNLEFYHKQNKFIAIGTIMASLINVVTNIIFIKMFGYKAAAYTTLLAYVLLFVFHWILVQYVLKINIYTIKPFLISMACVIGGSLFFAYMRELIIIKYIIVVLICLSALFWIKRNLNNILEEKGE